MKTYTIKAFNTQKHIYAEFEVYSLKAAQKTFQRLISKKLDCEVWCNHKKIIDSNPTINKITA